jgi:hypothetical protein
VVEKMKGGEEVDARESMENVATEAAVGGGGEQVHE